MKLHTCSRGEFVGAKPISSGSFGPAYSTAVVHRCICGKFFSYIIEGVWTTEELRGEPARKPVS